MTYDQSSQDDDPIRLWSDQLQDLVAETGLSHRQLAETPEIHLAHATISRYVKGERVVANAWLLASRLIDMVRAEDDSVVYDLRELRRLFLRAARAYRNCARVDPGQLPTLDSAAPA